MPKIVAEHTDNDLFQVLDSGNPRGFEDAQLANGSHRMAEGGRTARGGPATIVFYIEAGPRPEGIEPETGL
jgi:hypothetical protein